MEYHVRPLGKTCAASGRPFAPGTEVVSVLVEREGELVRMDYAAEAWSGPPEQTIAQWRCAVPQLEDASARPIDPEAWLSYFEQIQETADPEQAPTAYVLALFLLQKRRLKLEGARLEEDGQYLTLVGSRGEGPFEVRDQQLPDEVIQRLQAEIQIALQSEWQAA